MIFLIKCAFKVANNIIPFSSIGTIYCELRDKHEKKNQEKAGDKLQHLFDVPTKDSISKYLNDHKREYFTQAEFECKDKDGKTLLIKIIEQGDYELTKYVLDAMPNYLLYRWIKKPLFFCFGQQVAIKPKAIDVVESSTHETPLHIATKQNNTEIIKLLLDNNAIVNSNIEKYEKETYHPIHEAIKHNNTEIIERLLDAGARKLITRFSEKYHEDNFKSKSEELYKITDLIMKHCDTKTGEMLGNYDLHKMNPIQSLIFRKPLIKKIDYNILDLMFHEISFWEKSDHMSVSSNTFGIRPYKEFFDKFLKLSPEYRHELGWIADKTYRDDLWYQKSWNARRWEENIFSSTHNSYMYQALNRMLKHNFTRKDGIIIDQRVQVFFAISLYLKNCLNKEEFYKTCGAALSRANNLIKVIDTLLTMKKDDACKIVSTLFKCPTYSFIYTISKIYENNLQAVSDILNTIEVSKDSTKNTYYDFKKELEVAKTKYPNFVLTEEKKNLLYILHEVHTSSTEFSSLKDFLTKENFLILKHLNGDINSFKFIEKLGLNLKSARCTTNPNLSKKLICIQKHMKEYSDYKKEKILDMQENAFNSTVSAIKEIKEKYIPIDKYTIIRFPLTIAALENIDKFSEHLEENKRNIADYFASMLFYDTKDNLTYVEFVLGSLNAPKSARSYTLSTEDNPLPIINNTNNTYLEFVLDNCPNLSITLSDIMPSETQSNTQYLLGNEGASET